MGVRGKGAGGGHAKPGPLKRRGQKHDRSGGWSFLSKVIDIRNDRFGTNFTQADQLFFDQVKEQAKADPEVVQRAVANPYDAFALARRGKLLDLMIDRMGENQAIVTKYIDEEEFRDVAFEQMALRIYDEIREPVDQVSP